MTVSKFKTKNGVYEFFWYQMHEKKNIAGKAYNADDKWLISLLYKENIQIDFYIIQRKTSTENEQRVYKQASLRRENAVGHQINEKMFKFTSKSKKNAN